MRTQRAKQLRAKRVRALRMLGKRSPDGGVPFPPYPWSRQRRTGLSGALHHLACLDANVLQVAMSAEQQLLAKELDSLVQRVRAWSPTRWAAEAAPWGTRADLGRHLAQWLADQASSLEGQPQRDLPVLHPDLLVADQLAVTGDDLVRAMAADEVCRDAVAHLLAHRFDLLGEDPPASLGGAATLVCGREVCGR